MTISSYIVEFLNRYENLVIDTNRINDGYDRNGLFKSPSREVKHRIDGSMEITEHYQFLARQAAISDRERKEADQWLEDLTYWVDDYNMEYEYPKLDGNRRVTDISVTGCPTPMEDEDKEIIYQLALSITYEREREEV